MLHYFGRRFIIILVVITQIIHIEPVSYTHGINSPYLATTSISPNKHNNTGFIHFLAASIGSHSVKLYNKIFASITSRQSLYAAFEQENTEWILQKLFKHFESVSYDTESAVRLAYDYIAVKHWTFLGRDEIEDVTVLRSTYDVAGQRWPCIKAIAIIDLPCDLLAKLLLDSSKVHLINTFSAGRTDAHIIDPNTKIVWNRTKSSFGVKPYDFCTLMHYFKDPKSSFTMIISKATVHEKVQKHKEFNRAEVLMGINILVPCKSDSTKTEFTSISHVKFANIPPFLAARSSYQGTMNYMLQLKKLAPLLGKLNE
eukprot:gene12785-17141_t